MRRVGLPVKEAEGAAGGVIDPVSLRRAPGRQQPAQGERPLPEDGLKVAPHAQVVLVHVEGTAAAMGVGILEELYGGLWPRCGGYDVGTEPSAALRMRTCAVAVRYRCHASSMAMAVPMERHMMSAKEVAERAPLGMFLWATICGGGR